MVVYKIDRLTRSLADFPRMVELFDKHEVSFLSVTQRNTTSSLGRLTLNVLLSFAQFEREVTGERIRDKVARSKAKGMCAPAMIDLQARHLRSAASPPQPSMAAASLHWRSSRRASSEPFLTAPSLPI